MYKQKKRENTDGSYWKSYSDMMAALLLMFILIMTLALVKVNDNSDQLMAQKKELEQKEAEIEKLIGVKPQIIQNLKSELSDFEVKIDENTGDIEFKSDILFDYNMDELKSGGMDFLSKFIPKYMNVILSDKYIPYIAEIIVEGHTDTAGGYEFNLKLSQERAMSVANFIVGEKSNFVSGDKRDHIRKIMTVTGKSFTVPIYSDEANKIVDAERSRRVEIKFRLKDDETIQQLQTLIQKNE